MAFLFMKWVPFLLIVLLFFCSPSGAFLGSAIKGIGKLLPKHQSPIKPYPKSINEKPKNLNNIEDPKNFNYPHYKPSNRNVKHKAQEFGVKLANRYFGGEFMKGFRWGHKLGKRILSVARKCDKSMKVFESLYICPQPVHQSSMWSNSAIVHCIVEVEDAIFSRYNETCFPWYESLVYPLEATCILDQQNTLVSECST